MAAPFPFSGVPGNAMLPAIRQKGEWMRGLLLIAPLAIAAAAQPAEAQRLDSRLESVLACAKESDPNRRLGCFDAALIPLTKAAESGALESRSLGPKSLESRVRAMRRQGYSGLLVQLENGDRWTVALEGSEIFPEVGESVTVRRGVLGGWWFKAGNGRAFRATFMELPVKR